MNPPPFKGGQGRTDDDIIGEGEWSLGLCLFVVIGIIICCTIR